MATVPGVEARAGRFPGPSLIPALTAIQRRHGWLPREELVQLSQEVRRPLYEIEGLISFYPHFRVSRPSKVALHVCHDLSCWLAGSDERIAELRAQYGDDVEVEVVEVSCLGRCDVAPAVAVDEEPASLGATAELVDAARAGSLPETPALRVREEPWPNDPYAPGEERYRVLRSLLEVSLSADAVIASLKPGTFKDRQIMAEQPHLVLEGLLLGMAVCGCDEGWVFIRHEYGPEERLLREEIEALRPVLEGTGLRVEVFTSPGGYILGEESALIECMEGHRGEPRNKPPFPGVYGLWGKPTLMNSVETFAHVPVIVERGADWWRAQGEGESTGLKFFAVSGHVEAPGVYCVPMGTTGRELLSIAGGVRGSAEVAGIQPGGASSHFLGPEGLDVPLDFGPVAEAGSMLGSGALVVIAEGTDLLAAATNVLRFFRDESCGKCVPCRMGSHKAHEMLTGLLESGGGVDDVDETIVQLEETMRMTSICGLGQVALGPVISVLGMKRGGTEARPHPRTERAPEDEGGDPQEAEGGGSRDAGRGEPGDRNGGASP